MSTVSFYSFKSFIRLYLNKEKETKINDIRYEYTDLTIMTAGLVPTGPFPEHTALFTNAVLSSLFILCYYCVNLYNLLFDTQWCDSKNCNYK